MTCHRCGHSLEDHNHAEQDAKVWPLAGRCVWGHLARDLKRDPCDCVSYAREKVEQ